MDHSLTCDFLTYSSSSMDLDFMDKPLSQGCWPETSDKINFLEPESFLYGCNSPNSPGHFIFDSHHPIYRKENRNVPENSPFFHPELEVDTTISLVQPDDAESGKRCSMKERLILAIEYLKEHLEDSDVLIQIWVPTKKAGQNGLTTTDQPYFLSPNCRSLTSYRNISKTFHLTAEENLRELAGLPGRVYLGKLPEWTPDVRFFRSDECPRKYYAKMYNISGCLALPVFEQDSGICLAVIEIVTTTQRISYHFEVEIVCKALEAVDLKSSQNVFPFGIKACNQFYQNVVPEISEMLQSVCETFRLPLALTWAICDQQGENEYQQFSDKFDYYICTVDSACCVSENDLLEFYEACSEQYFFPEQGIVGKAFATNKQWFATDITSFSKSNYPLSHHARIFNLGAAVAIPLRNKYTGSVEYALELFLPRDCKDIEEQKQIWDLLPGVIQQNCQSFHVVMDKKLNGDVDYQVVVDFSEELFEEKIQKFASSPSEESSKEKPCWNLNDLYKQNENKCVYVSWECPKQVPEDEFKITNWENNDEDLAFTEFGQGDSSERQYYSLGSQRTSDKRQNKMDKPITLQVLRQYFAGSLKDAAKSIGVCPTTLKRICRQHGINRWPARKIKKVNHSLKKLQLVVNSIRGAEGMIQIDSFYKTFPELSSSNVSRKVSQNANPNKHQNGQLRPKSNGLKSLSSSSSQNSGSSFFYSTQEKQPNTIETANQFQFTVEDPVFALKTTCSEMRSNSMNQEEPNGNQSCQNLLSIAKRISPNQRNQMSFRVKATFVEENIRFSFSPNWNFKDLQQEIARRFRIDDFTKIDLKYLDIDNESVLLTCDADLEECLDLLSSSETYTIRITLHHQLSK